MADFDLADSTTRLREYMATHACVLVMENDEVLIRLEGDLCGYSIQAEPKRLVIHWWSPERNLVRRVEGLEPRRERLRLMTRRLGQAHASPLWLMPAGSLPERSRERQEFRRQLLGKIRHRWPEWQPTGDGATERGSAWQKIILRHGYNNLLCIALSPEEPAAYGEQALTHLLLWENEWKRHHAREPAPRTRLILPAGGEIAVALRAEGLRPERRPEIYTLDEEGEPRAWEPKPLSAMTAGISRAPEAGREHTAETLELLTRIRQICPRAELQRGNDGGASFRLHGLEFARQARGAERTEAAYVFGHGREFSPLNAANQNNFEIWLRELAKQRQPESTGQNPWHAAQPEAWLQQNLMDQIRSLDPHWDADHFYTQVSLTAANDCTRLDLLMRHCDGRLGLAEFKASEDPHFALQGLEYWVRIRQQQFSGELQRQGYFAGQEISAQEPRLYLIAPALYRHPNMQDLVAAFAPCIPVEQWLLNADWREKVRILERRCQNGGEAAKSLPSARASVSQL